MKTKFGQYAILNRTVDFKFEQSLRIGTKVQIAQVNENTCMVRIESEPTLEYIVSKDALSNPTMYFKDEGSFWLTKVQKDGTPADPNKMYEFGTLLSLTVSSKKEAQKIAKSNGYVAVFG
jgi:hypothetical protein